MFVKIFDKTLEQKLESLGLKKMGNSCFLLDSNSKFNFDNEDKGKYMYTNKLTF